jgi:hypothetical protein
MKIVMIINRELPIGLIANTAAVLGITAGKMFGEIVGSDNFDLDGNVHAGITTKTIPILSGTKAQIKSIRDSLYGEDHLDTTVIDFSEVAQKSLDYDAYTALLANLESAAIDYLGICIYGPMRKVTKLTGYLGLLR